MTISSSAPQRVLVLNEQFFPSLDPVAGQLASLSTFAVAFVARPLGGVIFGHFGDKLSRKSMLVLSLLMMGFATFTIGLLPGYNTIGVAAPVLLVLLRVVQGFGVGGEWGGAVLMAVEHAPPHKKAFYGAWPQAGVPAGSVLSSLVFFLVQLMPDEKFMSWGWRIPFLISAVLVLIGLFIRLRLTESPELNEVKEEKKVASLPFFELFKSSKKSLLIGIFCLVGSNTLFYIASVYLLSYAPDSTGLNRGEVLLAIAIGASFDVIAIPLVAIFADRHGKRTMMLVVPRYCRRCHPDLLGDQHRNLPRWCHDHRLPDRTLDVYATSSGFISGLFDPEVRYTGASISYQVGGLISSAPAPMISDLLFTTFDSWVPVALYLAAANLLAGIFVLFDTRNKALSQ